jgi:hypothetical protein
VKITLIENALDFVLSAVQNTKIGDTRSLKYAVLHLSDGVELAFKERLKREHWVFLFADTDKANEIALETGEFKSVDFDDCIKRLKNIVHIDLHAYSPILTKLRKIRNRLQHYEYSGTKEEVISILVNTWSFILDFLHDNLTDAVEGQAETIQKIKEYMIENQEFIDERLVQIKDKLKEAEAMSNAVLRCPTCLQQTLVIPGGEDPECLFCRYTANPEEAAKDWAWQELGGPDPKDWYSANPVHICPECGCESLTQQDVGDASPPDWICFNCGETWDYNKMRLCILCGNPHSCSEDDCGMCSDCWNEMVRKG